MRIAMVTGVFPVVSESFIVSQITGLIDLGHTVDIFAFNRGNTKILQEEVRQYKLLARTTYLNVRPNGAVDVLKWVFSSQQCFLCHPLFFLKSMSLGRKEGRYATLVKLIPFLKKNYDIVHCHFGPMGAHMIFLKDIFPHIKVITQFHGYDVGVVPQAEPDIYKELFARGDRFLLVSQYFRKKLIEQGCPASRITIHYCGVDGDKFSFWKKEFNFKNRIKILSSGRLVEKKGFDCALRAVALAAKKFPQIEYTIVGDGLQRAHLQELTGQLGLSSMVRFVGAVSNEQMKEFYKAADILLAPSFSASSGDEEGMPVVIKEAMASGVVVISTQHAGIPEMIDDEKTGFLVPEKDEKALTQKLEYVIGHPEICSPVTHRARQSVIEHFEQKELNKKLESIYRDILSEADHD